MVSAMLIHFKILPFSFCGEALFTACYISNRILHKGFDKSPYELLKGRTPNINYFRVWGCIAYVLDGTHKRPKLGSKPTKSIFIDSKACRLEVDMGQACTGLDRALHQY